ncbi:hypothetical protein [Undibacterium sp. Ji22W]|uniref:hypothetical protein n=1 Tax=Undibacterium sp. Ji22W TaxID=3413038 RepID=UPI003BF34CD2
MNKKLLYVALERIKPGAILAEELLDKIGHVLLPAGTELTASMLKAISNHNIHQLPILDPANTDINTVEESNANKEHQFERLNRLFRHMPYDGPTEALRTYVEKYRQREQS